MINELYTLVNNATPASGIVGQDLIDPDYRPRHIEAMPAIILDKLIGQSGQAKQYWLTQIRSIFRDTRFWGEPLGYFDPREGYSLLDLGRELDLFRTIKFDVGLKVESSKLYWRFPEYTIARWQLQIGDDSAVISNLPANSNPISVDFNEAGVAIFPMGDELNIRVYRRGVSGQITWATSPTDMLQDRVHRIQQADKGTLASLAAAASRFPKKVISGLMDISLCSTDIHRAAGAILLLVGGNLAATYDAAG